MSMMTTRVRYGTRAIIEIASHYDRGPVTLEHISEKEGLSKKYLHAIIKDLCEAGLVTSVRGPGGGFRLSRPPSSVDLEEVVSALEGPMVAAPCIEDKGRCDRVSRCAAYEVWHRVSRAVSEALSGMTLEDLVRLKLKKEAASRALNWVI